MRENSDRRFVVVSGVPGSGKTTLAHRLAPILHLVVLDKDDILDRLFESNGVGDESSRRQLSRQSDVLFKKEATGSPGAILVSHWHLPGMPSDSGTPTEWLSGLSDCVVNLHCTCPAEVAAARFLNRTRHPGHLDHGSSHTEILAGIRALGELVPLDVGKPITVDTSDSINIEAIAARIQEAFERCRISSGEGDPGDAIAG